MDIAVLSLSKTGSIRVSDLVSCMGDKQFDAYCLRVDDGISITHKPIDSPVSPWIEFVFKRYQAMVLVMPVGIAVRLIAPFVESKLSDPAVVCVDDGANFAISLVSGHIGGADALTIEIASAIGATPVVTSSSNVLHKPSIDLLGREYSWGMDSSSKQVTAVSAEVINDSMIGIFQDAGEPSWLDELDDNQFKQFENLQKLSDSDVNAAIVITDKILNPRIVQLLTAQMPWVLFRPPVLHIGIGCRKSTDCEELMAFTETILEEHGFSKACVASVSTIDLKKDDASIKYIAESFGVPLNIYTSTDIDRVFEKDLPQMKVLSKSANPKKLIGVWGVAEPTAILSSANSDLVVPKHKRSDATIAVAK